MRSGLAAALGVGGRGRAWDRGAPRQRIRDVALSRPRVGPSRARVTLEREGWQVGKQRVNRRDALEGLQRCERIAPGPGNVVPAVEANPRRDTGFVHDQMLDGRRVPHRDRDRSVESRERDPGVRRSAVGTMRRQALDEAARRRGLTVGDGTGPACAALDDRFWRGGVKPDCARPRKPIDNGPIESLNVRLRDEFVNVDEAVAMPDLRDNLGAGQDDDRHRRPRGSLGRWTPSGRAAMQARKLRGSGRLPLKAFRLAGKRHLRAEAGASMLSPSRLSTATIDGTVILSLDDGGVMDATGQAVMKKKHPSFNYCRELHLVGRNFKAGRTNLPVMEKE